MDIKLSVDGVDVGDPLLVAREFNIFFADAPGELACDLVSDCFVEYYLNLFTGDDVAATMCQMKPKTSAGADKIPITLIKNNFELLKEPLAYLFNLSLSEGKYFRTF